MKQMVGIKINSKMAKKNNVSGALVIASLEHMVVRGKNLGASFIHIEPRDKYILVRYRVGNNLVLGSKLPSDVYEQVLITLKNQAGLDPNETKKTQESKVNIGKNNSPPIGMSIMPIINGEKIIFDLRQNTNTKVDLAQSGYWGENLYLLNRNTQRTRGLIIVSSQDSFGSIESIKNIANNLDYQGLQMASLGSHIEAHLPKSITIKTSPDNEGHKLADRKSLKILLRRNPDAIFISYPKESLVISLALKEASSRLICIAMTSDESIGLLDKIIKLNEVHSTRNLTTICSQKSIKKLCQSCKESYKPNKMLSKKLIEDNGLTFKKLHDLELVALKDMVGSDLKELSSDDKNIKLLFRAKRHGCKECSNTGFDGTLNITELIDYDRDGLENIINKNNLNSSSIKKYLDDTGFISMRTDNLIKCLRGLVEYNVI